MSGSRYNFNAVSSDNEEPWKQVDLCGSRDHSIACEDRRVTVDIRDLIKHSPKKSGKCPKTLRDDGSRKTWSPRRDAKELSRFTMWMNWTQSLKSLGKSRR